VFLGLSSDFLVLLNPHLIQPVSSLLHLLLSLVLHHVSFCNQIFKFSLLIFHNSLLLCHKLTKGFFFVFYSLFLNNFYFSLFLRLLRLYSGNFTLNFILSIAASILYIEFKFV